MRTTITLDDDLLAQAHQISGLAGATLWTRDKRLHAVATDLALVHVEKQY